MMDYRKMYEELAERIGYGEYPEGQEVMHVADPETISKAVLEDRERVAKLEAANKAKREVIEHALDVLFSAECKAGDKAELIDILDPDAGEGE